MASKTCLAILLVVFCAAPALCGKAEEAEAKIKLYEHPDFKGEMREYQGRVSDLKDFATKVSAAKVEGPAYCKFRLYSKKGARGGSYDEIGPGDYAKAGQKGFLVKVKDNEVASIKLLCQEAWTCPCSKGKGSCPIQGRNLCRCNGQKYGGKTCSGKVAICKGEGDPHYYPFDGGKIDFMGTCKYTLVKKCDSNPGLPDFHVMVKNYKKRPTDRPAYTKYTEIEYANHVIRLGPNTDVQVDGVKSNLPIENIPDMLVYKDGRSQINVLTDFGLALEWKMHRVVVKVPTLYKNRVCGICGNYNGQQDDYVTKDGEDVSKVEKRKRDPKIGNSWRVQDPEAKGACSEPTEEIPPTISASDNVKFEGNEFCGLFKDAPSNPFAACLQLLPAEERNNIMDSCKYDAAAFNDDAQTQKDTMCTSLEGLVTECDVKYSIKVSPDWRVQSNCPLPCTGGKVYSPSASACPATCGNPNAEAECPREADEGCVCPNGQVENLEGKCVDKSTCNQGMCNDGGRFYKVDEFWFSDDCSESKWCMKDANGNGVVGSEALGGCWSGTVCSTKDGKRGCYPPVTEQPPLDRK